MKKILTRGGVELIAVVLGITLSLWVDDKRELNITEKNNVKTLRSIKNEVRLRIEYIEKKINQYQRDVEVGEYVITNWNNIDFDSIASKTKNDRGIVLTLKAYRAINLPVSIYNSLNSDGSIAKLDQDSIKIILNDLYEVMPAHIVDGVENERVLYHSFNEFIILGSSPFLILNDVSKSSKILLVEAIDLSNKSIVSPSLVKGHKNLCVKKTKTLNEPTAMTPFRAYTLPIIIVPINPVKTPILTILSLIHI